MPKAKDYFLVKSQRYFSLFKFRAKQFLKHTEYRIDPEEAAHAPRPPILQTKSHRTAKLHSGYTQALGKKKTYARNKKKISLPRLETIPILVSTIPMKEKTILILVFLHPYGKCNTPRPSLCFTAGQPYQRIRNASPTRGTYPAGSRFFLYSASTRIP